MILPKNKSKTNCQNVRYFFKIMLLFHLHYKMEYQKQLLALLQSPDEQSVAVGLEILRGQPNKELEQYMADYQTLYHYFFGEKPEPMEATHLVVFNQTELSRIGKEIMRLPPEIKRLKHLQELRLYNNRMVTLPAEIGLLKGLLGLKLSFNVLRKLPAQIGALPHLQALWLHNNELEQLPKEIGNLTTLEELDLSLNNLTSICPEIGQLHNLVELSLKDNQISHLPKEITQLQNLRTLYLSRNPVSESHQAQIQEWLPDCVMEF